jgi:hypothetical protein
VFECPCQTHCRFGVLAVDGPGESDAEIVEFGVEAAIPPELIRSNQLRVCSLDKDKKPPRVPIARLSFFISTP